VKTIGIAVLAVFAVVGVLALGVFALMCYENPRSEFATYDELAASGLIDRGWVSEYIPRSAIEIHESHDIDTSRGWASFKYTPGGTAQVREHCRLLHGSTDREKYVCPPFEGETSILVLRADGHGHLTIQPDH
jgi:hypothetical protein